ncbi:hypothetical protein DZF79_29205 [Vibrio parahaemolyticus]|nr:hypothetical protein [Vibrio parahaemolyticus]
MNQSPLNDNQRKGLPADIDLLATAISLVQENPSDAKRIIHLRKVIKRLEPQLEDKELELTGRLTNNEDPNDE